MIVRRHSQAAALSPTRTLRAFAAWAMSLQTPTLPGRDQRRCVNASRTTEVALRGGIAQTLTEINAGFHYARTTFDIPLATEIIGQARARVLDAGFTVVGGEQLIVTVEDVNIAVNRLSAQPLDVLVILQSTFADSTMAQSLVDRVDAPLLLWAIPEAPTGGRLRLNSLCGINLAGHALTRAGHRYHTLYAQPDDPAALDTIRAIAQVGYARRRLVGARIGRVGDHPAGFDTCRVNEAGLKQLFGVNVIPIDLPTLFEKVTVAEPHDVNAVLDELRPRLAGLESIDRRSARHARDVRHAARSGA
jgi:hypothetical protein